MSRDAVRTALEARIGYRFRDGELLERALTHVSAVPGDASMRSASYQRYEFLGDRVLGLAVSDMLVAAFPDADEGELSRRLAELVRSEACADVATDMDIGQAIRLGAGEAQSGGRRKKAILADVCEAVIGAVFLDGGFEQAKALVNRFWKDRMATPRRPLRDPKTALQEWAQGLGLAIPSYREISRSGPDHDPTFKVAVVVASLDEAEGSGRSKRIAEPMSEDNPNTRAGFVALIGAPNAGKSTLLNTLVGVKVSIVSHKVQTTRALVRGIAMTGLTQVIFVDTPGIFQPKRRLDRAMVTTAWSGATDADIAGLLIDAKAGLNDANRGILEQLASARQPKFLILNKVDLVRPEALLRLAAEANEIVPFEKTFMVSALNGSGVSDVLEWLAGRLPLGHWLYPEDQVSDLPLRMLASEITREKLFLRLHEELPYESHVETELWQVKDDGSIRVEQTIYVERESQKKIVIGKGGQTIKAISTGARIEIAEIAEAKVHLFLFVKVRENWADDPERYREMGLEFPR
jgi:GTP-binding protein Era